MKKFSVILFLLFVFLSCATSGGGKEVKEEKETETEVKETENAEASYIWPVKGVITSKFNSNGRHHPGIDIGCLEGTQVYAANDGKVVFSGEKSGYGRVIIIAHPNHCFTVYAHNSKNLVKEEQKVKKGEKIALVGQTGRATGPHLHFEIRIGGRAVDPLQYLPKIVP